MILLEKTFTLEKVIVVEWSDGDILYNLLFADDQAIIPVDMDDSTYELRKLNDGDWKWA